MNIHQKFLENDAEYTRLFSQITQQELELINSNSPQTTLEQINIALQTLDNSITKFHQHQAETLRIHEQYLNNQVELLNSFIGISQSGESIPASPLQNSNLKESYKVIDVPENVLKSTATSQVTKPGGNGSKPDSQESLQVTKSQPENANRSSTVDPKILTATLLEIVSEKTGYPTEMLALEMDMEADLGIDSIKRVEILGAMQTQFPDLPKADASALAEMRTLSQIVDYMSLSASAVASESSQENSSDSKEVGFELTTEKTDNSKVISSFSLEEIRAALLEIVSEKTGYPTEMLEMGMDMEADLGIDSIKRVEILGAMQERFPDLPKADASMLAEMRTLNQIIEYMSSANDAGTLNIENPISSTTAEAIEVNSNPQLVESTIAVETLVNIKQSLLEIVSEKTGYPIEMLELGMDLEADLGIDSIKRVEILGAMQEKYPNLPQTDTSFLSELRTLQQIIDSFSSLPSTSPELGDTTTSFEPAKPNLIRGIISLKSLPLPDQLAIEIPANRLALIVDDGSELTGELADKLITLGNKVVVLSLPDALVATKSVLPNSTERVAIDDISEESIHSTLKKVEQDFGPAGIFIHLDPVNNGSDGFSRSEDLIVKTIFLIAKILKDNLTQTGKNGYAAFLTVSRLDGQFGLSRSSDVEPVSGGLFGLTKTLNLEWDDVFCRAIDLSPEMDPEMAANCITAELTDPNRLIYEVAYNKNGRFTLAVELPEGEMQS